MIPEHIRRRQSKRRWTIFVSVYWVVVAAAVAFGVDALVTSEEGTGTKWLIGIVGGLIAGLLVHWGALQTVALRDG